MTAFKIRISWWSIIKEEKLYSNITLDASDEDDAENKLDDVIVESFDYDIDSITPIV